MTAPLTPKQIAEIERKAKSPWTHYWEPDPWELISALIAHIRWLEGECAAKDAALLEFRTALIRATNPFTQSND